MEQSDYRLIPAVAHNVTPECAWHSGIWCRPNPPFPLTTSGFDPDATLEACRCCNIREGLKNKQSKKCPLSIRKGAVCGRHVFLNGDCLAVFSCSGPVYWNIFRWKESLCRVLLSAHRETPAILQPSVSLLHHHPDQRGGNLNLYIVVAGANILFLTKINK